MSGRGGVVSMFRGGEGKTKINVCNVGLLML